MPQYRKNFRLSAFQEHPESRVNHTRSVNHVILTRFNLPSAGVQTIIREREGWLRERVELFERYCVPSVKAQTTRNFSWIVYYDPASPAWLRDQISVHANVGTFIPVFRESASTDEILRDIRRVSESNANDLLTTNLDNDDAIAVNFIAQVQAAQTTASTVAIYLENGLIRRGSRLYTHRYRRNAFNSVRTPWEDPVATCWSEWHTHFDNRMPVVEVKGPAAWMQVVHGMNVSNRVKGRLVSPGPFREQFGPLLDGVADPTEIDLASELALRRIRRVRDFSRGMVKRIVIMTLGRDGIDRAKVFVRSSLSWSTSLGRRIAKNAIRSKSIGAQRFRQSSREGKPVHKRGEHCRGNSDGCDLRTSN